MSDEAKPKGRLVDSDAVDTSEGKARAKMALLQKSGGGSDSDE